MGPFAFHQEDDDPLGPPRVDRPSKPPGSDDSLRVKRVAEEDPVSEESKPKRAHRPLTSRYVEDLVAFSDFEVSFLILW